MLEKLLRIKKTLSKLLYNRILDAACSDLVTEFVLEDFDEEDEPDQVGEVDHPAKQNEAFHRSDSEPVII
jgi:hypothetical protein